MKTQKATKMEAVRRAKMRAAIAIANLYIKLKINVIRKIKSTDDAFPSAMQMSSLYCNRRREGHFIY